MYEYNAKLVRVIDGDTVDLDVDLGFHLTIRERFRLEGIDTPEIRGGTDETKAAARAAKTALETMLRVDPKALIVVQVSKQGSFRRWLGTLFVPNPDRTDPPPLTRPLLNVNTELVKMGFAKPYARR